MPKCVVCKINKIIDQKRLLCRNCRAKLYYNKKLPPITAVMRLAWKKSRLISKYGETILSDLNQLSRIDSGFTLSDLGKKYGFSREYARQMFFNIYGYPFTQIKKMRNTIRFNQTLNRINYNDSYILDMYSKLNSKADNKQTVSSNVL